MKRKIIYQFALLVIVGFALVALIGQTTSGSDATVLRTFFFDKVHGVAIDIYTPETFEAQFGDNPAVPKTDQEVLELAREIYTPEGIQVDEECGEDPIGVLFSALSNPEIADQTRDEVDEIVDGVIPDLPETYTSGHFRFMYTTSDADTNHNVTLAAIQETAVILNQAWNDYVLNFVVPKHYVDSCGNQRIDIKVYYLGAGLYGGTHSSWNHIELNSKQVVMDGVPCKQETTPVHELFHRCQYTYGYVTGTSIDKWAVEGTASWSQKHRYPNVGDWMDRMNQGLAVPDRTLIGSDRSYDACFFWTWFGEQGGNEDAVIDAVWTQYSANGKNMRAAVETVSLSELGQNFATTINEWTFTNFSKDLTNTPTWADYDEDEWTRTCGGVTHGPLDTVTRTTTTLNAGDTYNSGARTVSEYGADYYVINLGAGVTDVTFSINGIGSNFSFARWAVNGTQYQHYSRSAPGQEDWGPYTYGYAGMDAVVIMVAGNPNSGSYSITATDATTGTCKGEVCPNYTQSCKPGTNCSCVLTAEGGGACVSPAICQFLELCESSKDCPIGSVCAVQTCCKEPGPNVCVPNQCSGSLGLDTIMIYQGATTTGQ